jgi:hypothetical protein
MYRDYRDPTPMGRVRRVVLWIKAYALLALLYIASVIGVTWAVRITWPVVRWAWLVGR